MNPEIAEYLKALRELREKVLKTLDGVNSEGLNWKPTGDETNSLFVIATHAVGSEHGWIYEILGDGVKTRNRSAEFQAHGISIDELKKKFAQVAQESEMALTPLTSENLLEARHRDDRGDVTKRWIILHVIQHYSEHIGQMYLTRQLWEDSKMAR